MGRLYDLTDERRRISWVSCVQLIASNVWRERLYTFISNGLLRSRKLIELARRADKYIRGWSFITEECTFLNSSWISSRCKYTIKNDRAKGFGRKWWTVYAMKMLIPNLPRVAQWHDSIGRTGGFLAAGIDTNRSSKATGRRASFTFDNVKQRTEITASEK